MPSTPRTLIPALAVIPALVVVVAVAARAGTTQSAPSSPAPAAPAHDEHALHNVHRIGDKLISGGVPDGDAAFDELAALGVKTVISVDGASPDLARAAAHGMRYVHIPISYAQVTDAQRLELARAVRDLPGPIYLHCHHGKHRGPAAAASVAVALGEVTNEEAIVFMKTAGTAEHYAGLYKCVAEAPVATEAELIAAPADFPEHHKPSGMVAAMVEVDLAYEHLQEVRAAGWTVPADHPDLVPGAEAGRLVDNLRLSAEDPKSALKGEDYIKLLHDAIAKASDLEESIIQGAPREALEPRWKLVAASCKDCHTKYRDKVE